MSSSEKTTSTRSSYLSFRCLRNSPNAHEQTISKSTANNASRSGRPTYAFRAPVSSLTSMPVANTTTTPIRLCQRNATLVFAAT